MPANDSKFPNLGGMERRAAYVEMVRHENPHVLLLQAGDIVQGTPYFNIFQGKVEMELMNSMKYDASCLGNHEFDLGLEGLSQLVKWAKFPFLAANYDFSQTSLQNEIKDYIIIKKGDIKIGIFGIGINPEGLIAKKNYEGMQFLSPLETANKIADYLKQEKTCDLVICLSHLGYYNEKESTDFGDIQLASESKNIDIIIGGHTHTFLFTPDRVKNQNGNEVIITQMGKNGIFVGRLDVEMEKIKPD
jgi:5'-nucleotidase